MQPSAALVEELAAARAEEVADVRVVREHVREREAHHHLGRAVDAEREGQREGGQAQLVRALRACEKTFWARFQAPFLLSWPTGCS